MKYENEVRLLKEKAKKLKEEGKTSEEIARILHSDRREIGLKYKDLTPPELREKIYKMNMKEYGDPLGPSIDYLRNVKGKTWDQITESAGNPGGWSRLCEFLEKNGIDPNTYFQKF